MLEIAGHQIPPGEETLVRILAGKLPSGETVRVNIHVFRSVFDGPVVLFLAGMHGDEVDGIEIIRRLLKQKAFEDLQRGTVLALPLLNFYGFNNFRRDLPDGRDINRSFPGNMSGSLGSRIARIVSKHLIPVIDFGVDFHSGGAARFNFPQVRISRKDPSALDLAEAFAPPFIVEKPPIAKSLRKIARDAGKPILIFEGGESGRLDGLSVKEGIDGVKRLLKRLGMIREAPSSPYPTIIMEKASWVRASVSGLFIPARMSGDLVKKGEELGEINDLNGLKRTPVFSKFEGYIIGHNNGPVVNQGDALFHIGRKNGEN